MKTVPALIPVFALLLPAPFSGAAPDFTDITRNQDGTMHLGIASRADAYYILWRNAAANFSAAWTAEAVTAGTGGALTISSNTNAASRGYYRVEEVPLTEVTRDADGDGMPDVFEIQYPACLNGAVDDAAANCDGDARSNLNEFLAGTNPVIAETISGLVINEVDYDQAGTDTTEFVEIRNNSASPIPLHGIHLGLINGANNAEYGRIHLGAAGSLAPGQYLVVGPPAVTGTLPAGVLFLPFSATTNAIQNGAPDGLALITPANSGLLDAMSYEGAITEAQFTGFAAPVSLVERTAIAASVADSNTAPGSFSRLPNGADTDDSAADWKFSATPTPGAANVP